MSLAPSPALPLAPSLLSEAKDCCAALLMAEQLVREDLHAYNVCTWQLGKKLAALKESGVAKHGNWMFFIDANFPELGPTGPTRVNRANDARGFFEDNPNYPELGNFTEESIRKRIFRLAPEKERPQLAGDQKFRRDDHPLTFINSFAEWRRKVTVGLITAPPVETLRKDFEPVIRDIAERCGRDYVLSLLAEPA